MNEWMDAWMAEDLNPRKMACMDFCRVKRRLSFPAVSSLQSLWLEVTCTGLGTFSVVGSDDVGVACARAGRNQQCKPPTRHAVVLHFFFPS